MLSVLLIPFAVSMLVFASETSANSCPEPCPLFWVPWRNHCYRYFAEEVSWYDALNFCRLFSTEEHLRDLADLVSIHSAEEHEFVYHYWKSFREQDNRPNRPGLWIGLIDEVNGVHKWTDGSPLDFTNFDDGEEANTSQWLYLLYDYGSAHGKWHDVHDSQDWHFKFMCKMPRPEKYY